jgi:hypothetical protein
LELQRKGKTTDKPEKSVLGRHSVLFTSPLTTLFLPSFLLCKSHHPSGVSREGEWSGSASGGGVVRVRASEMEREEIAFFFRRDHLRDWLVGFRAVVVMVLRRGWWSACTGRSGARWRSGIAEMEPPTTIVSHRWHRSHTLTASLRSLPRQRPHPSHLL